jgi:hypothetical protein
VDHQPRSRCHGYQETSEQTEQPVHPKLAAQRVFPGHSLQFWQAVAVEAVVPLGRARKVYQLPRLTLPAVGNLE